MRYLSKMSVCCRKNNNNGFIIGMCFGLIISLLLYQMSSIDSHDDKYGSTESVDRNINKKRSSLTLLTSQDNNDYEINNQINRPSSNDQVDEYAPKIKKPSTLHLDTDVKKQWRFIRPRYYFTELGIREKLFLGVLTNPEHLHSRGMVFNKTVGHLIEKIRYFITINEGSGNGNKPNVTLSGIVGFTDARKILKPFHVIKYIIDNYLDDYDYYFIIKDSSYVNARQLMALVESFSIGSNKEIYLGVPIKTDSTNNDNYINDNLTNFCSLDAGILISNSIMRELKKNLDWCVKNTLLYSSQSDDVNFGRCLYYSTKIPCSRKLFRSKNEIFAAKQLPDNFDFLKDFSSLINNNYFDNLVSVYPIYDPKIIYRMHAFVAAKELEKIENVMMKLRNEISGSAHLGPVITSNSNNYNSNRTSWPVGINPGNKAPGRFDILRWNYFNASHIFGETDFGNVGKLRGSKKLDIDYVLMVGKKIIEDKYDGKWKYQGLVNGYMRFDASRGMDYILDLSFADSSTKESKKVVKRIELCKPLGKVELLAAPYVTENTRVNLILMVDGSNIDDSIKFIKDYGSVCMEKRDKTTLMLVFLYDNSSTKGADIYARVKTLALSLTDKYNKSKEQTKIIWLSVQLPKGGNEDPRIKVAVTDLVIKKFSLESLILFVQTRMELTVDYLNRIRMNTIIQWQVFSPIPFVEYNPNLYESDQKSLKFDLSHNHGYYDTSNYESISFYAKDYRAVRRASEKELPQVHSDREINKLLKKKSPKSRREISIFKLFVSYSDLHIFRGIEPALKIHYSDKNKNVCGKSALGHRGQLARLIDEYKVI